VAGYAFCTLARSAGLREMEDTISMKILEALE
jgi:hypothetical protein